MLIKTINSTPHANKWFIPKSRFLDYERYNYPTIVRKGTTYVVVNAILAIHELGHYIGLKMADKRISEYQVGIPRVISYTTKDGERFSWGPFPFLGFVLPADHSYFLSSKEKQFSPSEKKQAIQALALGPCAALVASFLPCMAASKFCLYKSSRLPFGKGLVYGGVIGITMNVLDLLPSPFPITDGGKIYKIYSSN
jgi:membrane-associated protease RseP (regulator of RpoE activity)